jgi:hypothetical protein
MERRWLAEVFRAGFFMVSAFLSPIPSGDDECIAVWSIQNFQMVQKLEPFDAGQVTALVWIRQPKVETETLMLCAGTGRGTLLLYPVVSDDGGPKVSIILLS